MNCACELHEDDRISLCGAHANEMRRHLTAQREMDAKVAEADTQNWMHAGSPCCGERIARRIRDGR